MNGCQYEPGKSFWILSVEHEYKLDFALSCLQSLFNFWLQLQGGQKKRAKYYCSPLHLVTSSELTNIQSGGSFRCTALLCFALIDVDNIIFLGTCAALKQAGRRSSAVSFHTHCPAPSATSHDLILFPALLTSCRVCFVRSIRFLSLTDSSFPIRLPRLLFFSPCTGSINIAYGAGWAPLELFLDLRSFYFGSLWHCT